MSSEKSFFEVIPSEFQKSFRVPTSKSYSNRLLILAAIKNEDFEISNISDSSDVTSLIAALRQIGLDILEEGNRVKIKGSFPDCEVKTEKIIEINGGDGGTTNRFLLPLLSRGKNKYYLKADPAFLERPMGALLNVLKKLGCYIDEKEEGWLIQGATDLKVDQYNIDCRETTQFISGLKMAYLGTGIEFIPNNLNSSQKYYELTNYLIDDSDLKKEVPLDFSSLSYPLALASHRGIFEINDFFIDEYQADSALLDILKEMGGKVKVENRKLFVEKSELKPIDINCSAFPDLVPTLVFLCAYANGESKLSGLEVLRHKESDRLAELAKLLTLFSIDHEEKDNELIIKGSRQLSEKIDYYAPNDHRLIMTAYLFMRYNNGGKIYNYSHVKKSYPNFFRDMQ